jgi:hypothetical protein
MKRRVKLYKLEEDGSWSDIGTGWADIENEKKIVVDFDDEGVPRFETHI